MSLGAKWLKSIHDKTKLTVLGYLRQIHEGDDNIIDIQPLIVSICLLYFYVQERFKTSGKSIKINEDGTSWK